MCLLDWQVLPSLNDGDDFIQVDLKFVCLIKVLQRLHVGGHRLRRRWRQEGETQADEDNTDMICDGSVLERLSSFEWDKITEQLKISPRNISWKMSRKMEMATQLSRNTETGRGHHHI